MSVKIEKSGPVATIRMDKSRANAIDGSFVDAMTAAVREVEGDPSVRAVLLASAHPRVFCPGLDLVGLVELDRAAMKQFMERFALMCWSLFALGKPVVAAVGGHAVAGGCVVALTADYRVLKRGANIGLNEVRVGVPLPWTVTTLLKASVRPERLSEVALLGRNFAGEEAVAVGLAQELADEDFEEKCQERLAEFVDKDAASLMRTKQYLRAGPLADMKARETEYMDEWLASWFSESTRARIKEMVAGLGEAEMIAALLLAVDLHLQTPRAASTIEGAWTYAPLDGSASYQIQIRATQGGFYQFEGRREGAAKPVLQFDRAEEGSAFRGEVADGFDPCVSAGARFSLFPAADNIVFEPSLPVSAPFSPLLPGPCTSVRHYFLTAKGRGDQVRLKPPEELAGSREQGDKAAANVTIGAPTLPDGSEVELLGSFRDSTDKLWHHIKVDKKNGYVPAENVQVRWECRLRR